jgi:hypothetical protein
MAQWQGINQNAGNLNMVEGAQEYSLAFPAGLPIDPISVAVAAVKLFTSSWYWIWDTI